MPKLFTPKDGEAPTNKQPKLRVAKSAYHKVLLKRIAAILGYTLIGAFIVYLCFAATIMRAIPTLSGAGVVAVKENTFHGGIIPEGVDILANTTSEQDSDLLGRLKQSFVPSENAAVVRIVSGPYNSIGWVASGIVTIDGNMTEVSLAEQPLNEDGTVKKKLKNEYLTVCVEGDCTPGEGVIIPQENIYGLTLHDYSAPEEVSTGGEK